MTMKIIAIALAAAALTVTAARAESTVDESRARLHALWQGPDFAVHAGDGDVIAAAAQAASGSTTGSTTGSLGPLGRLFDDLGIGIDSVELDAIDGQRTWMRRRDVSH